MAKRTNKLDLSVIKNASSKQFTTKTVCIPVDGKDYFVEIDTTFKTTKIEKMVMTFLKSEDVKELEKLDESSKISYFMFMIIRNFTSIGIPENLGFAEQLNLINNLIDLGIFEKLAEHISDDEVKKVNEFMQKFNVNLDRVIEEMNNEGESEEVIKVIDVVEGNEDEIESGDLIE